MKKLSLFSGIGLDDLASEWAGIETVCMCEKDDYCQRLLRKRFPGVPIIGDVHEVTKERVQRLIADTASRRSCTRRSPDGFGTPTATDGGSPFINIIGAGPPCQPISVAGQRKGKTDDRWLWDEAVRVVFDIKPDWVVFENPTGILSMAQPVGDVTVEGKTVVSTQESDLFKGIYTRQESLLLLDILESLKDEGYDAVPFEIPACGVGAFHRRYRVFIVAHRYDKWEQQPQGCQQNIGRRIDNGNEESIYYPAGSGLPDWAGGTVGMPEPLTQPERPGGRRSTIPGVCGVANGRTSRVDRLRGLGNAVVPQQVYPVYQAIVKVQALLGKGEGE